MICVRKSATIFAAGCDINCEAVHISCIKVFKQKGVSKESEINVKTSLL